MNITGKNIEITPDGRGGLNLDVEPDGLTYRCSACGKLCLAKPVLHRNPGFPAGCDTYAVGSACCNAGVKVAGV